MSTAATPARERIAAITIVILVHALVVVPALLRDTGGSPGEGPRNATGKGLQEVWIPVDFVAEKPAPKPGPPVIETPPSTVPVEDTPTSESAPDQASADASAKPQEEAASPEATQAGGGSGAPEDDLGARYLAAVRAAIVDKWDETGGGAVPAGCKVVFDQAEGGKPLRAWVMNCADLPLAGRIRLETAVMQVQRLPYEGFEPVFQEHLELEF